MSPDVGGHLAPHAEGRVQAAHRAGSAPAQSRCREAIGIQEIPAATSLPSGCRTKAAGPVKVPKSVVTLPSDAEGGVQAPIGLVARQGEVAAIESELRPPPRACRRAGGPGQWPGPEPPKSVVTCPPPPKVGSRRPSGRIVFIDTLPISAAYRPGVKCHSCGQAIFSIG